VIRHALLLGAALAALPSPAVAHTIGGEGGAEIELLLAGVVVVVFGLSLRSAEPARRWVPAAVIGLGVVVMTSAFVFPRLARTGGTSFARVEIVAPRDGEVVRARRPVRVAAEVRNGAVAESPASRSGGHLHLFVDGRLEQMPYGTEFEVRLDPGEHRITVEYVNFEHVSFDPRVRTSVEVSAR
jgi:hypothetical protein